MIANIQNKVYVYIITAVVEDALKHDRIFCWGCDIMPCHHWWFSYKSAHVLFHSLHFASLVKWAQAWYSTQSSMLWGVLFLNTCSYRIRPTSTKHFRDLFFGQSQTLSQQWMLTFWKAANIVSPNLASFFFFFFTK